MGSDDSLHRSRITTVVVIRLLLLLVLLRLRLTRRSTTLNEHVLQLRRVLFQHFQKLVRTFNQIVKVRPNQQCYAADGTDIVLVAHALIFVLS